HHSVIHTCITVRMIVTDDITHSFGGFPVPFLECVALFEHRIQYSSLHRLQTVPDIGNRAVLDHIFTVPSETVADDILQPELLHIICHEVSPLSSNFATSSFSRILSCSSSVKLTFDSIHLRLISTLSPMSVVTRFSDNASSSILTWINVRESGFIVVSQSWAGIISPRPL